MTIPETLRCHFAGHLRMFAALLFALCGVVRGEEWAVFTCTRENHEITHLLPLYSLAEGKSASLTVYKPEKKVGTLDTGARSLAAIHEAGMGWTIGRFLGGGATYLLRNKAGACYGIFMEYGPGALDQRYRGRLYKIGKFDDLGSGGAIFIGLVYESGGDDPLILKQLWAITERVEVEPAAK